MCIATCIHHIYVILYIFIFMGLVFSWYLIKKVLGPRIEAVWKLASWFIAWHVYHFSCLNKQRLLLVSFLSLCLNSWLETHWNTRLPGYKFSWEILFEDDKMFVIQCFIFLLPGYQMSRKSCVARGARGACMWVQECNRMGGTHVGVCVDGFMFGSCCRLQEKPVQVVGEDRSSSEYSILNKN